MSDGVALHELIVDHAGRAVGYRILDVNTAWESTLGIPRGDAVGRPASIVYGTGTAPFLDICARAAQSGIPATVDAHFDPPGKTFKASIFPAGDAFITVFVDVAQRRGLEQHFRQAQKMEALGRMAGDVAHDLNNLLMAIGGYSEILLEQLEPGNPLRPDAEQILRASDRAATLTRDLLACSRRQAPELALIDVNELLTGAAKMLRRVLGEAVELIVRPAPRLPCVRAEAGRLDQVVMNLSVNARDAMPGGGRLTLETACLDIGEAELAGVATISPGVYLLLAATDTGAGISTEIQARIFDPFFTTKAYGKGTGLGLSTVFSIVKQCGGYIRVQSAPGTGSRFEVLLPAARQPQ